jgi:ABC-2 type transport system permease protein
VEISKNEAPNNLLPFYMPEVEKLAPDAMVKSRLAIINEQKTPKRKYTLVSGTTAIRQLPGSTFNRFTVLQTNSKNNIWMKIGPLVADSLPPVYSPQEGDFRDSSFSLQAGIYRNINGKEQRIMLSGDADYYSNRRGMGVDLVAMVFSWLDNNRFPNFAARPDPMDRSISVSSEVANMQVWIFLYILPALVLLLGIVLLVRRKRK